MKILIVEDDFASRYALNEILSIYGECHTAVNGEEGVELFKLALESGKPFDLICLDIMMPKMTGQDALKLIREIEYSKDIFTFEDRVKVVMITALDDFANISQSFASICDEYLFKPISKNKIVIKLQDLHLI